MSKYIVVAHINGVPTPGMTVGHLQLDLWHQMSTFPEFEDVVYYLD